MDKYKQRRNGVLAIVIALSAVLMLRLFYVQIIAQEYKQFAEQNARSKRVVQPSRGLMLDRNGNVLVSNETIYDLLVIPSQVKSFDTTLFCSLLQIDIQYVKERLAKAKAYSYIRESFFLRQISLETFGKFQERQYEFRGFYPRPTTVRKYQSTIAPHLLGYLGEVTDKEMTTDSYYDLGDYVGKSGLEKEYEAALKGEKGIEYLMVDRFNRVQGAYNNGDNDAYAVPGFSIHTTIDSKLQAYGELLMKNKIGALVAIEPATGEILAMVSSVGYDPNMLVGRNRKKNYPLLSADTNKPLFNRSIAAMYPPGSIYKTIMALVGLQEGVITPYSRFPCHMGYVIPGLRVGCHAHRSNLDLKESIAQSCNAYYCNVFRYVIDNPKYEDTEAGFERWREYMEQFGIGIKLGIDIPNEKEGILPTSAKFDKIYGAKRWRSSYIISLAIGQAEISLTPLQMANFTAAIANKGYFYTPHLLSLKQQWADTLVDVQKNDIEINKEHFETVIDGMAEVFKTGTARWYQIDGIEQCGKTGTAENPHGEDHSNFIAFAPRENPKIAIAVVVENGGFGSTWAAPIASLMIEKYLTDTITRPHFEKKMLEKDFINPPIPEIAEIE